MENWKKYLQNLGLSENDSKVYLELLKMGPSPVQELARAVGLSRVSVYAIIEFLMKSGLITTVEKGKKQMYAAEPPERVVALAENKVSNLQAVMKEIKSNIGELKLIQSGDKPIVKMYEGPEVFMAMQEDLLRSKTENISEFGNLDEIERVYPYEQLKPFHAKIGVKKINRRIIYQTTRGLHRENETNKKIKYLDQKIKPFKGDFFLYEDTVWLSNFSGKQMTVMIKSKEIKDTLQVAFDIVWATLK